MENHNSDIYETKNVVNVTYVIDSEGEGWYCYEGDELSECTKSDDFLYDREFGG